MCEAETERHAWRSRMLAFIRDHVEAGEIYRLDSAALECGELLPVRPESLEQQEYEERTAVGFSLGRLAKSVDRLASTAAAFLCVHDARHQADDETDSGKVIETTNEAQEPVV
jgi:hypothetical protein